MRKEAVGYAGEGKEEGKREKGEGEPKEKTLRTYFFLDAALYTILSVIVSKTKQSLQILL
jgi:hypothetical protein